MSDRGHKEELWENAREYALELDFRFFAHWAILSGGTLTLLIPFVKSLTEPVESVWTLYTGEIFLLLSLIISGISLYVMRKLGNARVNQRIGEASHFSQLTTKKEHLCIASIIFYITALFFLIYFVNVNIL